MNETLFFQVKAALKKEFEETGKIDFRAPKKSNAQSVQAAPAPAPYTARVATNTPERAVSSPYNYYAEPTFNSGLRGGVD